MIYYFLFFINNTINTIAIINKEEITSEEEIFTPYNIVDVEAELALVALH